MTLSKNGVGYAALLVMVFGFIGVDIDVSTLNGVLTAIGTIASFVAMFWNQVSRPDTKLFFFNK